MMLGPTDCPCFFLPPENSHQRSPFTTDGGCEHFESFARSVIGISYFPAYCDNALKSWTSHVAMILPGYDSSIVGAKLPTTWFEVRLLTINLLFLKVCCEGARCLICTTVHNVAGLNHAKLPQ